MPSAEFGAASKNSADRGPRAARYPSLNKVTPPAASRFDVLRQAVLDRVAANDECQMVLVRAPAGFGKTTAMKQLAAHFREGGLAIAWLTLDDADNDISRFLIALSAAIDVALNAPRRTESISNDGLVLSILDRVAAVEQPMAFFFDEFEILRNSVVIGLIANCLDALPPGTRLVIGSRVVPELGLARLRARGILIEVDAELLRFTSRETETLLVRNKGIALDLQQIERLNRSAEGWIAALWLASIALEKRQDAQDFLNSFSGSNAAIAEYLAQDVLAKLPPELREFLLHSCILSELSPSLCDAVCGIHNSREQLRALQDRHLFLIALDESGDQFRFHSLFRDFLRNQLRREQPQRIAELHRLAAQAYLDSRRPIPATKHALQAGDMSLAMSLVELQARDLLGQGRVRLLAAWMEMLPAEALDRHPLLRLIHAWCVTFTRGAREALAMIDGFIVRDQEPEAAAHLQTIRPMLLAMVDRIEEAHEIAVAASRGFSWDVPFASAMLNQALTQTSIILGRHADARRCIDELRRVQGGGGGVFGLALAEWAEALLDLMGGHVRQAHARLSLATHDFNAAGNGHRAGNALLAVQLAETLYEVNNCKDARRLLEFYIPLVQELGLPDVLISAHVLLSRIVFEQGERDRAVQLLAQLESIGYRLGVQRAVSSARLERSQQRLLTGDGAGALEQLELAESSFDWQGKSAYWFIANDTLTPVICRLRWMVRTGQANKALPLLRAELAEAESLQRARRALKLRILLAEALHGDGQFKLAQRTLSRALQYARTEGMVRSFLEEGAVIQALLADLQKTQQEEASEFEDFSQNSLDPWLRQSVEPAAGSVSSKLLEPLTRKELETLQMLARGYSNNEMAERLFISESTVRTHLRNINFKLQVRSRTQAVAVARKLGLLG